MKTKTKKRPLSRKERTVLNRLLETARKKRLRIGRFGYYSPPTDGHYFKQELPTGGGACAIGTGIAWGDLELAKKSSSIRKHHEFARIHQVGLGFPYGLEDVFEGYDYYYGGGRSAETNRIRCLREEEQDRISREDYRSGRRVGRALLERLPPEVRAEANER